MRFYAHRDLAVITGLRAENGDAVVVLPDWEDSTGAKAEVAVARWVGLRVLTLRQATCDGSEAGLGCDCGEESRHVAA
jgi:hypothetical protein